MSKKRNKQDKPQGTETENDNTLEGTEGTEGEAPARDESTKAIHVDEAAFFKQDDSDGESKEDDQPSEDDKSTDGEQDKPEEETTQSDATATQSDDKAPEVKYDNQMTTIIARRIGEYAENMHPAKTQTSESIKFNQLELYSIFNTLLSNEAGFAESMRAVITTVRDNRRAAFRETAVFRGMGKLGLGRQRSAQFDQLINLFLAAADSKNPKEVSKVVDFKTLYTKYLKSDQAQSLLSSYFNS